MDERVEVLKERIDYLKGINSLSYTRMCEEAGIKLRTLQVILHGDRKSFYKSETIRKLAKYFGVTTDFLLGYEGEILTHKLYILKYNKDTYIIKATDILSAYKKYSDYVDDIAECRIMSINGDHELTASIKVGTDGYGGFVINKYDPSVAEDVTCL